MLTLGYFVVFLACVTGPTVGYRWLRAADLARAGLRLDGPHVIAARPTYARATLRRGLMARSRRPRVPRRW